MKLLLVILFSEILGLFSAPYSQVISHSAKCRYIMEKHGLTGRFPGAVAHGIHSITLEDIRYYFNRNATENNKVPTLNYDLQDKQTVLPNARRYGYDTGFYTIGMRHLDQVMMNMDKKNFYLTNYNTLEKLVHTIHMAEVWAKTKVHYDAITRSKLDDEDLCTCVTDLENNGIMKMLPFMSLKIRYPGITSGKVLKLGNGGIADWSGNLYNYTFFNNWSSELAQFNFNQDIDQILDQATGVPIDRDEGIKHLDNEEAWAKWKSGMKGMVDHDDYELAMFLYCTLKEEGKTS